MAAIQAGPYKWPEDQLELDAKVRAVVRILSQRGLTQEEWDAALRESRREVVQESGGAAELSE